MLFDSMEAKILTLRGYVMTKKMDFRLALNRDQQIVVIHGYNKDDISVVNKLAKCAIKLNT